MRGLCGIPDDRALRRERLRGKTIVTVNRGVIDRNRKRKLDAPPVRAACGQYGRVIYGHVIKLDTVPPGTWWAEDGFIVSDTAPKQSKAFRNKGLKFGTAEARGWKIVKIETKHVFVRFVGDPPSGVTLISDRSKWPSRGQQ